MATGTTTRATAGTRRGCAVPPERGSGRCWVPARAAAARTRHTIPAMTETVSSCRQRALPCRAAGCDRAGQAPVVRSCRENAAAHHRRAFRRGRSRDFSLQEGGAAPQVSRRSVLAVSAPSSPRRSVTRRASGPPSPAAWPCPLPKISGRCEMCTAADRDSSEREAVRVRYCERGSAAAGPRPAATSSPAGSRAPVGRPPAPPAPASTASLLTSPSPSAIMVLPSLEQPHLPHTEVSTKP